MSGSEPSFDQSSEPHQPNRDPSSPPQSNPLPNHSARMPWLSHSEEQLFFPSASMQSPERIRVAEEMRNLELCRQYLHYLAEEQFSLFPDMGEKIQEMARSFRAATYRMLRLDLKRAGVLDPSIDLDLETCGVRRTSSDEDEFVIQAFLRDTDERSLIIHPMGWIERTEGPTATIFTGVLGSNLTIAQPQIGRAAMRELFARGEQSWVWSPAIYSAIEQKVEALISSHQIDRAREELFDVDRLVRDEKLEIIGPTVAAILNDQIYDFVLGLDGFGIPRCAEFRP